jgi:predicted Rossmann fold flavoprotein
MSFSPSAPPAIDVVVVGGGAAGLMAAISAARHGAASVALLEGSKRLGTKILMSGGTRCNVTHDHVDARDYFGGSRHVVARLLRAFSHLDTVRFFEDELGVPLKREETGKLFPVSDDAQEVVDALIARARALGVAIRPGHKVTSIARDTGAYTLGTTEAGALRARRVILTTGGLSFPGTGSDGTGYALVQSLGHTIERTSPALTPLVARSGGMHERLRGVTLPVGVTVLVGKGGRKFWEGTGSFLFTHFGYSGPVALDASRHVAREAWTGPVTVMANFLTDTTPEAFERELLQGIEHEPRRTLPALLRGRLPESLMLELLARVGVEPARPLSRLSREERRAVVAAFTAHELPVLEVMGYRKAEVTAGGVPLAEVDPSTLESRRSPGLHLAGEILNVDGRLGGYNFQFAWSTGHVAGRSAALARTGGSSQPEN